MNNNNPLSTNHTGVPIRNPPRFQVLDPQTARDIFLNIAYNMTQEIRENNNKKK